MALATPAEVLSYMDARTAGDLVTDDGTRVSAGDLLTDTNFQACIDAAEGWIFTSLDHHDRYLASDLEDLTGVYAAIVHKMVADVTMLICWERRPSQGSSERRDADYARAQDALEAFRQGKIVFGIAANQAAGIPAVASPTLIEMAAIPLLTSRASRVYPTPRGC